jgi:hypothetical protein
VEGSNGQRLFGPDSFVEATRFINDYEKKVVKGSWSASHDIPNHIVEAGKKTRLGYILRRIQIEMKEI